MNTWKNKLQNNVFLFSDDNHFTKIGVFCERSGYDIIKRGIMGKKRQARRANYLSLLPSIYNLLHNSSIIYWQRYPDDSPKIKRTWEWKHDLHPPKCSVDFPMQFFNGGTSRKYFKMGYFNDSALPKAFLKSVTCHYKTLWCLLFEILPLIFSRSDQIVVILEHLVYPPFTCPVGLECTLTYTSLGMKDGSVTC